MLPIVAIVGPPNAGKSSLLNKIAGKPLAVTSEVAGTTRDRQYLDTAWNGSRFTLVDTAGLDPVIHGELEKNVSKQIEVALFEADALLLVLDGKQEVRQLDHTILKKFRNSKKPVILAVNKLDSPKTREITLEKFKALGIKKLFAVSAVSGLGVGDLLDEVGETLKDKQPQEEEVPLDPSIAISIVGKPNVGKSSIFNKILKHERAVVSPIPGTTRTAVDERITINDIPFIFIDTAGLKKKEHRQAQPDIFSGFQTFKSIRRSDICFFIIDSAEEITKQDQRVANEIFALEKGCIILANKIDLTPPLPLGESSKKKGRRPADDSYQSLRDLISHHFPFLWMCPLFFVSAVTGEGLDKAIDSLKPIFDARNKTIEAEVLKDFLHKKLKTNPPKLLRDQKKPKVYGLKQIDVNPPAFELLVNHPAAISQQFRKFLENSIVKELDFWGTPIKLRLLGKDKA